MKALLITDLYPPDSGGRSDKMRRHISYFPKNNYQIDVLCPTTINSKKTSKINRNSSQCFRCPPFLFKHLGSLKWQENFSPSSKIGNLYIKSKLPAGYIRWLIPAFFKARKLIKNGNYQLIICVSNPLMMQLLGILLKLTTCVSLVCELRDPIQGYFRSRHPNIVNAFVEFLVSKHATHIIEWEDFCPNSIINRFPIASKKYTSIKNVGFDPKEYSTYNSKIQYKDSLNIVYTGGYYGEEDLWKIFFKAFENEIINHNKIIFNYYGDWDPIQQLIIDKAPQNVKDCINIHGRVPKKQCIEACEQAHLLLYLLDITEENDGRVSSKVYDYFASKRPIMAILPKNSASEKKLSLFNNEFIISLPTDWVDEKIEYQKKIEKLLHKISMHQKNKQLYRYVNQNVDEFSCLNGENVFSERIISLTLNN